ncbi:hypothetical protein Barb4_01748 [Bacteroidales bacterium Barb4]|nr:hypothetical protein Barb4_01748 [Bacteroidales bacterium Barb4]
MMQIGEISMGKRGYGYRIYTGSQERGLNPAYCMSHSSPRFLGTGYRLLRLPLDFRTGNRQGFLTELFRKIVSGLRNQM